MAESTIVRVKRDGTITINDGTAGTAETYTVAYEAGDLAITIPGPTVESFLDRGEFGTTPSLRYGNDQPCTFTFTGYLRSTTESDVATLVDLIAQTGYVGSDWVSTLGTNAAVFAIQMVFTIEGSDHGGTDRTITFDDCVLTGSITEGDPTVVSISGTCYDLYPTIA